MSNRSGKFISGMVVALSAVLVALLCLPVKGAWAADPGYERFVGDEPTLYATPDEAVAALVKAVTAADLAAVSAVLGLDAKALVGFDGISERLADIGAAAAEKTKVDEDGDDMRVVLLGSDVWEFPFPLLRQDDGKWAFDTYAGLEEIVNRRVGENELQIIETLRSYVRAQREYASADRDDDGVLEFAQKLISSEGTKDGLYWPLEQGDGESPAGPSVDPAAMDAADKGNGYFGYRLRVVAKQGDNVAGGAYDYVINGNMIAGYALVAWPVRYAETGVHTFMVSHAGIVYEKDLGPDTAKLAEAIESFNPDDDWDIVSD
jgi:hypothetical protein